MPSKSFQVWNAVRKKALDKIEDAHGAVGKSVGTLAERRAAMAQINQAYAMLLSAQFQGYCRDLHSECVDHVVGTIANPVVQKITRGILIQGRKLDSGNPNPGNLGSDFARFGVKFWDLVKAADAANEDRKMALEELNEWRNAFAHQNFTADALNKKTTVSLQKIKKWRTACRPLAQSIDEVMRKRLETILGASPW